MAILFLAGRAEDLEVKGHKAQIVSDLVQKGIESFERKEYKLAKQSLNEALRYEKNLPTAYALLGDIAYLEQDLRRAKEYYTQGLAFEPHPALKKKLERIESEFPVEEELDRYTAEHFIIRYDGEVTAYGGGFEIREYLREAYRSISSDLGVFLKGKVVVVLYHEDDYYRLSEEPSWSAGHFDGKIRLPAYRKKWSIPELKRVLWHEVTHAFVEEISKGQCPRWLHEGLAKYEENRVNRVDLDLFEKALQKNQILSLEELGKGLDGLRSTNEVHLFYQQSFALVRFLVNRYRMYKIKGILLDLASGKSWEEALKENLFLTPASLESRWLSSLKEGS